MKGNDLAGTFNLHHCRTEETIGMGIIHMEVEEDGDEDGKFDVEMQNSYR